MRHYQVGEWTDFVRNLVPEEERIAMQQHRAHCSECSALAGFLEQLCQTAQAEQSYESASASLAASARNIFGGKQPSEPPMRDRVIDTLRTLVAYLTYDSAAELRPLGARSYRAGSRQMLYEAGDYCVDLRFNEQADTRKTTLVGQIANRTSGQYVTTPFRATIRSNTKVIAESASNEFGEFSFEFASRYDLRVCVSIPEAGLRLEVPLKPFSKFQ